MLDGDWARLDHGILNDYSFKGTLPERQGVNGVTIYMVECGFSNPAREAEWNEYYNGPKLAAVLSVPGFLRSQRFCSAGRGPTRYIALHALESDQILSGANYKGAGGGSFHEWQPYIIDWRRTQFAGAAFVPEVAKDNYLLVIDGKPSVANGLGVPVLWLEESGLDGGVPWRGVAELSPAQAKPMKDRLPPTMRLFSPMTPQLRRAA